MEIFGYHVKLNLRKIVCDFLLFGDWLLLGVQCRRLLVCDLLKCQIIVYYVTRFSIEGKLLAARLTISV